MTPARSAPNAAISGNRSAGAADPVLDRAGVHFATLTRGSFAALRIGANHKGDAVIEGLRPDGEGVPVAGMSTGTCDQLYLSLRLASLEKFVAENAPFPLVVDDVLMSSDEQRAEAALRVLAEVGRTTQVIVFTHQRVHVELAEAIAPDGGVYVHRLAVPPTATGLTA